MLIRIVSILLLLISFEASAAKTPAPQTPAPTPKSAQESANDSATCVAKWDRYHESQRCFAKYRRSNGTMKPSAYKHCKEVKMPVECSNQ